MTAKRPALRQPANARRANAHAYHHGNLRQALLEAGEIELAAKGVEGFSLREVAKRAGVSHAAPAHHFGDSVGLLSALAALGFERFVVAQLTRQTMAIADGVSQLIASGLGYIDFAIANPALFRLMFASDRPNHSAPELCRTANMAANKLEQDVLAAFAAHGSSKPDQHDITMTWALAHGLADLLISGRLAYLLELSGLKRDKALTEILRRGLGHIRT